MSSKLLLSLVFVVSLTCFGQVISTGGYVTNAPSSTPISAASAPLVSTPDAALPGSGPAVGVPLGSSNSNDSRVSTGPSVYNPNTIPTSENKEAATANAAPAAGASNSAAANAEPFEFGVQHVISETPAPNSAVPSLGEIARDLRAHPRPATKVINNETVARLNAEPSGIGALGPLDTSAVAATAQPLSTPAQTASSTPTLMAQNQPPALPQSDQSEVPETPQASATAGQQKHATATQSSTSSNTKSTASAEQNPAQTAAANESANEQPKLPQTATHLPVFLLLGGLGIAGGASYLLRR